MSAYDSEAAETESKEKDKTDCQSERQGAIPHPHTCTLMRLRTHVPGC